MSGVHFNREPQTDFLTVEDSAVTKRDDGDKPHSETDLTLKRRMAVTQHVLVCSSSAQSSFRSRAELDLLAWI